jgi:S1-C subfamily serine protease
MSFRIQCPGCQVRLQIEEAQCGQKVRCPKCNGVMQIPAAPVAETAVTSQPPPVARPIAAPVATPASPGPTPEQKAPAAPVAAFAAGQAPPQVSPAPAFPEPEDDDLSWSSEIAEGTPARRSARKSKKLPMTWIIAGACGGGVVLAATIWLVFMSWLQKPEEKAAAKNFWLAPKKNQPLVPAKAPPEKAPDPLPVLPRPEIPPGPAPAAIAPETIQKVKKATAYLKVTLVDGQVTEGSGFFAIDPGLIVTNAHVLGMLSASSWGPKDVEVVIGSGEPGEVQVSAQVLGVDRDSDLAILSIKDEQRRWPAPLAVDDAGHLAELQKVIVFGFPYGAQLGKNITISESTISSVRRSDGKTVTQLQLNGGISPGNSGGPVVDTRGVVIGVAVSIIRGTQINFAVPGDKVKSLLRGRVSRVAFGDPYRDGTNVKLPLELRYVDPLEKIQGLQLTVWTGKPGTSRPASAQQPQPESGDGPKQTVKLDYRDGKAEVELSLPSWDRDKAIWVQPVLTDAGQTFFWSEAVAYQPTSYAPLERKPATLAYLPELQPERTVKLKSTYKLQAVRGMQFSAAHHLESEVRENASKDTRGAAFRLQIASLKATEEVNGQSKTEQLEAEKQIRDQVITVVTDSQGKLLDRKNPQSPMGKEKKDKKIRREFTDVIDRLANTYELTCLTLSPQQLQPGETWQADLPMLITSKGKRQMIGIHAVCAFQGIREHEGQRQAQIALSGKVHDGAGNPIAGQISGKILFSLDKGYILLADIKIEAELAMGESLMTASLEAHLERSAGKK